MYFLWFFKNGVWFCVLQKNEAFHLHYEGLSNKSWSDYEGIKIKFRKLVHGYLNTFVSLMKSFNSLTKFLTLKNPCYKNLPKSGEILNVDIFQRLFKVKHKGGIKIFSTMFVNNQYNMCAKIQVCTLISWWTVLRCILLAFHDYTWDKLEENPSCLTCLW